MEGVPEHVVEKAGDSGAATGRQRVMDGAVGGGLGGSHSFSCTGSCMMWEELWIKSSLGTKPGRQDGFLSIETVAGALFCLWRRKKA